MNDYFELKIKINPEIAEILSAICFENLPCEGVVQAEETYKDDLVLVSTTEDTLKVYLTSNENAEKIIKEQRNFLLERGFAEEELGSWEFTIEKIENQDWSKKWKENWDVTHVSEEITIVPSWIDYQPKSDEMTIVLDPGSAFGTGTHPTTQLCMRAIEKYFTKSSPLAAGGINDSCLSSLPSPLAGEGEISMRGTSIRNLGEGYKTFADIGTGSGILAICASKFGAKSVYGCDNDELVIETAKENAKMNNVEAVFEHKTADHLTDKFDFITANILHNVLAEIMGDLKNLMADDAKLVLSGIMDEKKQVVLDAIKAHNLKLIEELTQDIWVAFVVSK